MAKALEKVSDVFVLLIVALIGAAIAIYFVLTRKKAEGPPAPVPPGPEPGTYKLVFQKQSQTPLGSGSAYVIHIGVSQAWSEWSVMWNTQEPIFVWQPPVPAGSGELFIKYPNDIGEIVAQSHYDSAMGLLLPVVIPP